MVTTAWSGAHEADLVGVIIDARKGLDEEAEDILRRLVDVKAPKLLVLNKIDVVAKEALLSLANEANKAAKFEGNFMVSTLTGDAVTDLKIWLGQHVPPQVLLRPFGVATFRPAGRLPVNATPVKPTLLGLRMVKRSVVVPFTGIVAAPKVAAMLGGRTPAGKATLPILLPVRSVNQRAPSGPLTILWGLLPGVGTENSVIAPAVVMRPILSLSANQRAPSVPAVIPSGELPDASENRVTTPAGVMRPTLSLSSSVNQRFPSGPAVMSGRWLLIPGARGNSATEPPAAMRPMLLAMDSVNQRVPSGNFVMPVGWLKAVGTVISVTPPAVLIRPILPPPPSVNQRAPSWPATIAKGEL
jgi:hypothetical protein